MTLNPVIFLQASVFSSVKWESYYIFKRMLQELLRGSPCGSDGKETICSAGDLASISELGRSAGGGDGDPLQYSCLENPTDRGAWWAAVYGVRKSQTRLSA